jgi:hypothetical protein
VRFELEYPPQAAQRLFWVLGSAGSPEPGLGKVLIAFEGLNEQPIGSLTVPRTSGQLPAAQQNPRVACMY